MQGGSDRVVVRRTEPRPDELLEDLRVAVLELLEDRTLLRMRRVLHLVGERASAEVLDELAVVLGGRHHREVPDRRRTELQERPRHEEPRETVPLEEQLGRDGPAEEDVVVQIEIPVREAGDVVELRLDGVRVEDRQR